MDARRAQQELRPTTPEIVMDDTVSCDSHSEILNVRESKVRLHDFV